MMMSTLASSTLPALAQLDAWLGLERLSLSDPETSLAWAHPLPAWAWVLVILAAVGFGIWSYMHLQGAAWMRSLLAGLRVLTLLLIAVLLAGPELTRTDERVEPDWVLMLVDRSASMQIRDVAEADGAVSRDQQLRRTLSQHAKLLGEALGEDREVRWLSFDEVARTIESPYTRGTARTRRHNPRPTRPTLPTPTIPISPPHKDDTRTSARRWIVRSTSRRVGRSAAW